MARTLKTDRWLFGATILLVCAGLVMIYSASGVRASARLGDDSYFLEKQIAWAAMGLPLLFVLMRLDYQELRRPAVIWTLLGLTVAGLLAVFFFPARNEAHRWMTFGGLSLQPSELAKPVAVLFAAALLDRRMHQVNDLTGTVLPIAAVTIGLAGIIVMQPDFGTASVLVAVIGLLLFSAGLRYRYMFAGAAALLPAAILLVLMKPYRLRRLLAFFSPEAISRAAGFSCCRPRSRSGPAG